MTWKRPQIACDGTSTAESSQSSLHRIVVGLDFGTYGTGIAYSVRGKKEISYCKSWPGMPPPAYPKTISAILYENLVPIAWGWNARNKYMQELDDNQRRSGRYVYIDEFKLALDKGSRSKSLPPGFTPVQVIADFLRMFKEHCIKILRDAYDSEFPESYIQWCLTVPAMWKDDQKDAMKQAALQAGLTTSKNSDKLCIILEPEAALIHAHVDGMTSLSPGTKVMMVDAGGGTVDLTVHTAQTKGETVVLAETAPGIGGFCGSTYVDKNFEAWFRIQVGAATFDAWKVKYYGEYLQVMAKWEEEKRRFKPTPKPREVSINLPGQLFNDMDDDLVQELEESSGFDDRVFIDQEQMKKFFEPQIQQVVALVKQLARSCHGGRVDKMLLAGGFSTSPYFAACMKERLGSVCNPSQIIVPPNPESIILKGAATYASAPEIIVSRRMRSAYGLGELRQSTNDDPTHERVWDPERGCEATSVFSCLVNRGQLVDFGEVVNITVKPWSNISKKLLLTLFSSPDNSVTYQSDPKLVKVAELIIDVADRTDYVDVSLMFGKQELTMSATNRRSGQKLIVTSAFCQNSFN